MKLAKISGFESEGGMTMTKYLVRVEYEYPVDAIDAEDALSTVPKAKLVNKNSKEACQQV